MSDTSNAKTESTATFLTALWVNGAIFAVELAVFTFVRTKFVDVYEPRTKTKERNKDDDKDYTPTFYEKLWSWPWHVIMLESEPIMHLNGLDAYFFVRFLLMMCYILLPIWFFSWAILLPVTATSDSGKTGLDMFTFGNISPRQQDRYAAHIILVYLFTFWIWKNIITEMNNFLVKRQLYLAEKRHRESAQARTVLITGIEDDFLSERALTEMFSVLPGGVQKVWLNRNLRDLPEKYKERQKLCKKLEGAENKIIRLANKQHRKLEKSGADAEKLQTTLEALVPENKRPTFRHPAGFMPFSLPLIGKKEDTIRWTSKELRRVNFEMRERQRNAQQDISDVGSRGVSGMGGGIAAGLKKAATKITGNTSSDESSSGLQYPPLSSAFILFHEQIAAHMCVQSLAHHKPYNMTQRYLEISPPDIIWGNLGLNTLEMRIRTAISYGITAALIILWAIPVAFLGAVSNIANLCATYHWLSWICTLPKPVIGILQGVLPPALLAVLNMLLPIFLRLLSKFEGTPTKSNVELSLMTRYFIFNVVNSFLIVTLSSGIIAALPGLVKDPGSIPSLLASSLPQASNFFLTYVLLQGLAVAANAFLQIVGLVIYLAKLFFLGSTPRSLYNVRFKLNSVNWGTVFPLTTLVAVIVITYSIISPIINGLACAAFYLFYLAYKYLFTYRLGQPKSSETGGRFFPKAIQHLFVGLYIQQICLAALFFLARNDSGKPSAVIEGALMIVLLGLTIFFHIIVNDRYGPLIRYLPINFQSGVPDYLLYPDDDHPMPSQGGVVHRPKEVPQHTIQNDAPQAQPMKDEISTDPMAKGADAQDLNGDGVSGLSRSNSSSSDVRINNDDDIDDDSLFKFAHPAIQERQQVIWIPRDELGIWKGELQEMLTMKKVEFDQERTAETEKFDEPEDAVMSIRASTQDAVLTEKGRVELLSDREPPERSEVLYLS
ncbi:DUF221-domain-containing protein [Schizopora paradoxa]|uniref:DUF221-domain-containing protein n=1 Tax=Schizopora paradoxa TaxID=27342 RepID=A0A0H2RMZ0_9AGAM|nr:DUF221-domain-containing protein [Schizopora paradoxa]